MKSRGNHGASGLGASEGRRLLTPFRASSTNLCETNAKLAIREATFLLTFRLLSCSCQLRALDKCPVVLPIRIDGCATAKYGKNCSQLW